MRNMLRQIALALTIFSTATVHATPSLQLVTGNNYKPFTDESLPNGGLSSSIVRKVFEEAGYKVDLTFMPWSRGYESTKSGAYVATFPYVKRPDRVVDFFYSQPINTITQLVFVKKSNLLKIEDASDLIGLTTCIPRGYAITKSVGELIDIGSITKVTAPDTEQCYLMLKFGRADFLTFNQYVGWSAAQKALGNSAEKEIRTLATPLETEGLHLIFPRSSKDSKDTLEQFNRAFTKLKDEGVISELESGYLEQIQQ